MKFPLYMTGQCPHIARSGGPRRSYLAPLTPGLGLTIIRGLRELHTYQLPLDLVRQRSPERPVALVRPRSVAVAAQWFQDNLKADVFYAVKANPSRWIIEVLVENGVNAFDVASLAEIELVRYRCRRSSRNSGPCRCRRFCRRG